MKLEALAILSRTTTDVLKSKQLSPNLVQVVLDVYITPQEWAMILESFYDNSFKVTLSNDQR